ncbi:MAG: hypothetical protein ACYT04_49270, partial [Nostoc sp.]
MFKKSINIFTLSTSLLIFWNNSALSNIPNNSTEYTDNYLNFATQKLKYQNKNPNSIIAQGIANNINISGSWTGNFTCGETNFPISVTFRQVPRDANNINILADIEPNPPTGKDIKTFKGAFDLKTLNMTLATLLGNQIWTIAGHFDPNLQNFITDRAVPCSLTLTSSNSKPNTTPPSGQNPINEPANQTFQPNTTSPSGQNSIKELPKAPELVTTNQIDLTDTWNQTRTGFRVTSNSCTVGSPPATVHNAKTGEDLKGVITIVQNGNQIRIPDRKVVYSGENYIEYAKGNVSGSSVSLTETTSVSWGFTNIYTGTISNDGNTVKGKVVCKPSSGSTTAEGTFTWKRQPKSQSVRPTNLQSNVSLAGKWQSDWGPVVFNPDLTGYWNQGSGVGQIKDGTYDPKTRKLIFHYYQPWNDMNGTATFTLAEDGNQLSGSWSQQRVSNPPGSGGSGGWTMTRVNIPTTKQVEREI